MLLLSQSVIGSNIISLRTGNSIGRVAKAVFNPNNLKIEGFFINNHSNNYDLVLLSQDVREITDNGIFVNDQDALAEPNELIRLKEIIQANFELINKPVQTVSHEHVGKVNDYAFEKDSLFVQKLYVGQSLLKNFRGGNLSVDRTQIQEITNRRIIINDLLKGDPFQATAIA